MNVDRKEAKELIDGYFETYPGVKAYMDKSIQVAQEKGYVETIFHRKRFLPDINSRNAVVRGYAERNAINAPYPGKCGRYYKSSNGTYLSTVPSRRNTSQNDPASA
mgnify:CR=1 FL=1